MISRAGAGTINDLIKFIVFLPFWFRCRHSKDDHQLNNAQYLKDLNLGIIIKQGNNNYIKVKEYINNLISDEKLLKDIKNRFNKVKLKKTNELIYNLISNE